MRIIFCKTLFIYLYSIYKMNFAITQLDHGELSLGRSAPQNTQKKTLALQISQSHVEL